MNGRNRIDALNRLLRALNRSLPVYLSGVRIWIGRGQEAARETLARIAADDCRHARRLAEAIRQEEGRPDPGTFPTGFTSLHDVSARFLLERTLEARRRDLATAECCAAALDDPCPARAVVEEVVADLRRHVETLEAATGSKEPK